MIRANSLAVLIAVLAVTGCTVLGDHLDNQRGISRAPLANTQGKSATEVGMVLDQEAARKIVETLRGKPETLPFVDAPDCAPDRKKVCSALEGCKCVTITAGP